MNVYRMSGEKEGISVPEKADLWLDTTGVSLTLNHIVNKPQLTGVACLKFFDHILNAKMF